MMACMIWSGCSRVGGKVLRRRKYDAGAGADGKTFYEVMGLSEADSMLGQRTGVLSAVEGCLQVRTKDIDGGREL
ncbi:hypothetical protein CERZMDRAFT_89637 [Cercospora zeae-maydis SCOH1-5]|uniref:Uncharacterized protein n=1 Tax=Cercospora zeae-maydis SCOH1-5 TaxID=717836 RepID=A0A6A6FXF5_9PEZI|nr:hypothetical protein CERZMDRAFT_89637 [Cercospora zeae-maydis SCOH1-5]